MVLRSYSDRKKLEALARPSGLDEGFDDRALYLEARRSLLPSLEQAHEAGEGVTEEVLDGVFTLGKACMWMHDPECLACFEMAKKGFVTLFGDGHAKSVAATYQLVVQTAKDDDERIAELRALWEWMKVSLPGEAATYQAANQLGAELKGKCKYEEAKVFYLAALEGRRRVLWGEH